MEWDWEKERDLHGRGRVAPSREACDITPRRAGSTRKGLHCMYSLLPVSIDLGTVKRGGWRLGDNVKASATGKGGGRGEEGGGGRAPLDKQQVLILQSQLAVNRYL